MRDGLSRSRAEGLVQQLELWWLSENQQKRDNGIIVTLETTR